MSIVLQDEFKATRKAFDSEVGFDLLPLVESYIEWSEDEVLINHFKDSALIDSVRGKGELAQKVIIARYFVRFFLMIKATNPDIDVTAHISILSPTMDSKTWLKTLQYKVIGVFKNEKEKSNRSVSA